MNRIDKCDFCYGKKNINLGNGYIFSLNLSNNKISITHFNKTKNKLIGCVDINYCPFCGNSLNNVKNIKHNL